MPHCHCGGRPFEPCHPNYIFNIIVLIMENNIIVEFKETYMPHSVKRICNNMTKNQIIEIYDLNSSDIEWYKFIEE